MKNSKLFLASAAPALAIAAALLGVCSPVRAQSAGTSIVIPSLKPPAKGVWLKAEIIHADARSMVVREQGNPLFIHTFTYAEPIQPWMQHVFDKGGFQYGDHVRILYAPGNAVALKIRGKPSKAL